ncbi:MAG: hypothetical protein K2L42_06870 [Clostridia bacterium]|nr:hypothetical protein [Clostridia bacterium]
MKRLISVIVLSIFVLFSCACVPNLPYNAKFYDKAENWFLEKFLADNKTHYPFETDNLPEYRCRIVSTDTDFDNVFKSFPEDNNFSQDILVVYLFTDIYYGFDCELKTISSENNVVTIEILHKMPQGHSPETSLPTQRCLIVKLTGCEYEDINVKLSYE